jgi:hypothetical protein
MLRDEEDPSHNARVSQTMAHLNPLHHGIAHQPFHHNMCLMLAGTQHNLQTHATSLAGTKHDLQTQTTSHPTSHTHETIILPGSSCAGSSITGGGLRMGALGGQPWPAPCMVKEDVAAVAATGDESPCPMLLLTSVMLTLLLFGLLPSNSSTLATVSGAASSAQGVFGLLLLVLLLLLLLSSSSKGQSLQRQARALHAAAAGSNVLQTLLLGCQAGQWVCMLLVYGHGRGIRMRSLLL